MISLTTVGILTIILKITSAKFCDCYCRAMDGPVGRIVGGSRALKGEFPWMIAIIDNNRFCGGVLVSKDYVLTAAHCIAEFSVPETQVIIGATDITSQGYPIAIKRFIPHKDFDGMNNDIALVQLARKVVFEKNKVQPACLPDTDKVIPKDNVAITGWGHQRFHGAMSRHLRKVTVKVLDKNWCGQRYNVNFTNAIICAGLREGGKDACQGDSGGPLHAQNEQYVDTVGIVSWGEQCAEPRKPGIYTRIMHYFDWINKNSGNTCICNKHKDQISTKTSQ